MTMTKADLIEIVSENCSFSKLEAAEIVDQVFQILKETLEKGERVKISGFGNFITCEKRPRKGRNPRTGEAVTISGRRVLKFKPCHVLRKVLNKENQSLEKIAIKE